MISLREGADLLNLVLKISSRWLARPARLGLPCLLLLCGLSGSTIASAQPDESPAEGEPTSPSYASTAAEAVAHFKASRYTQALATFDQALAIAPPGADRATLEFNAAACLFELGRFQEAERRFTQTAHLDARMAPLALLNAGMSALRDGRLDAARQALAKAPPGDAEAEQRRQTLADQIRIAGDKSKADEREKLIDQGADALRQRDYRRALWILERARFLSADATREERADIAYGVGTAAYQLGEYAKASRSFEEGLQLRPEDAELQYWAARAAAADGDTDAASAGFERALTLGLQGDDARDARERLALLGPLPKPGWGGWLGLGIGYDTNPEQSGLLAETTVSTPGRRSESSQTTQGSMFGTAGAGLHHTSHLGRAWATRIFYDFDWLAMFREPVQDLSLQAHELGGQLYWVPTRPLHVRLTVAPGLLLGGLGDLEPFAWDLRGALRGDIHTSKHTRTRLEVELRKTSGLSGYEYLTGLRTDLSVSERLRWEPVTLALKGRLRNNNIGVQEVEVSTQTYPQCGARCTDATYLIPLGYTAPAILAEIELQVGKRVVMGGNGELEWRRYEGDSFITGVPESAKTRRDRRLRGGVFGEVDLDEKGQVVIVLDYHALLSDSNMARDTNDPEHALDYDDRSYIQHVIEAGVEVNF